MKWIDWLVDWWRVNYEFDKLLCSTSPIKPPLPEWATIIDCGAWTE